MPGFLKNKWLWIGVALIVVLVVGFNVMSSNAAKKKAADEKAATQKVETPYAAVANGKVDIEGGIIQIAARRGGVVRDGAYSPGRGGHARSPAAAEALRRATLAACTAAP